MLSGSLGLLPSASLSADGMGLYEPIHGSAPDLKGQNVGNPIATILSVAMMLKYSFNMDEAHNAINDATKSVLRQGFRTKDIQSEGATIVGTREMGDLIVKELLA